MSLSHSQGSPDQASQRAYRRLTGANNAVAYTEEPSAVGERRGTADDASLARAIPVQVRPQPVSEGPLTSIRNGGRKN